MENVWINLLIRFETVTFTSKIKQQYLMTHSENSDPSRDQRFSFFNRLKIAFSKEAILSIYNEADCLETKAEEAISLYRSKCRILDDSFERKDFDRMVCRDNHCMVYSIPQISTHFTRFSPDVHLPSRMEMKEAVYEMKELYHFSISNQMVECAESSVHELSDFLIKNGYVTVKPERDVKDPFMVNVCVRLNILDRKI